MKKILLLGGYGNAGKAIATHLLQHVADIEVMIAGRDLTKAENVVEELTSKYTDRKVGALQVDISDAEQLAAAFRQCDFVVNAASAMEHTGQVVQALIRGKKSCLDTQLSLPKKLEILRKYTAQLAEAGVTYITDSGFHPGMPAALVRWGAMQLDELEVGNVYCALKVDWASIKYSPSTQLEMLSEFEHFDTTVYKDQSWSKLSMMAPRRYDFGEPFGEQSCTPMCLEELRELPTHLPNLKETGFYVTGFNTFVDYLILPIIMIGIKILPKRWARHLMKLFIWGTTFSKPPFGVQLEAVCRGYKNNEPHTLRLSLRHTDAYVLTAIPVVACIKQWLEGKITAPGLHFQANVVEPEQFLQDLQNMGIDIRKNGDSKKIKHVTVALSA